MSAVNYEVEPIQLIDLQGLPRVLVVGAEEVLLALLPDLVQLLDQQGEAL